MKLKTPIIIALTTLFATFLAFTATAFAAEGVTPDQGSLLDLAKPVYEAIMAGHYLAAACLAVVVVVTAARRYAPGKVGEFLASKPGAVLATFATALAGAFATALLAGAPFTLALAKTGLGIAVAAAGGYSIIRILIVEPLLASSWYANKAPAWLKAAMGLVLWAFTQKESPAIAKADAAGAAAVAANPSKGLADVAGPMSELK